MRISAARLLLVKAESLLVEGGALGKSGKTVIDAFYVSASVPKFFQKMFFLKLMPSHITLIVIFVTLAPSPS